MISQNTQIKTKDIIIHPKYILVDSSIFYNKSSIESKIVTKVIKLNPDSEINCLKKCPLLSNGLE